MGVWTGAENKQLRDLVRSGVPLVEIVKMFPAHRPRSVRRAIDRRGFTPVRSVRGRLPARELIRWVVGIQTIAFGHQARPYKVPKSSLAAAA